MGIEKTVEEIKVIKNFSEFILSKGHEYLLSKEYIARESVLQPTLLRLGNDVACNLDQLKGKLKRYAGTCVAYGTGILIGQSQNKKALTEAIKKEFGRLHIGKSIDIIRVNELGYTPCDLENTW